MSKDDDKNTVEPGMMAVPLIILVISVIILVALTAAFAVNNNRYMFEIFGNAWGIICLLIVFPVTLPGIIAGATGKPVNPTASAWTVTAFNAAYVLPMLLLYSRHKFSKLNGMHWAGWFIAMTVITMLGVIVSIAVTVNEAKEEQQ